jgi:hypothetical protein
MFAGILTIALLGVVFKALFDGLSGGPSSAGG